MIYIETKQQTNARNKIVEIIEDEFGVPRELWEVRRTRATEEIFIRDIYIHMLYNFADIRLNNIAKLVGLRGHATVIQSLAKSKKWLENPEEYKTQYQFIKTIINRYEKETNELFD
jgi:chromosomal replication initiation ATPase DnaA